MNADPRLIESSDDGVVVLSLVGEHDIKTAPQLEQRLRALVETDGGVVVDLGRTTFLDSAILKVLLDAVQEARRRGKGFSVLLPDDAQNPAVRRIFELTELVPVFPVLASREQALEEARGGRQEP